MAKYNPNKFKKPTKQIMYPSKCGSHKSMLSTKDEHEQFNAVSSYNCILEDERGHYVTQNAILDNGLRDFERTKNINTRNNMCITILNALKNNPDKFKDIDLVNLINKDYKYGENVMYMINGIVD